MKHMVGVILLILNGLVLSGIWSCFKEAIHEAKNSRHKVFITIICFLADSWELITLAFLTLMFGLICIH